MTPTPPQLYRPDSGRWQAISLSAVMHVLLLAALIFSVKWQTKPTPVAVELWTAPPTPVAQAEPAPTPPPRPEPSVRPPAKAEPKPAPALSRPDIVTQKEKAKPPQKPPAADFREQLEQEARQLDRRKEEMDKLARADQQRRAADAERRAAADQAKAKARADYENHLRGKIRGNVIVPPGLQGNPKAVFRVEQLPGGDVLHVRMLRSSGSSAYDRAVEAAILKSSPLPVPSDISLFERELELTFCPKESDAGCPR